MSGTFVIGGAGLKIAEKPPPTDWRQIEENPQAMPAERGAVEVTLRPTEPGAAKKITITSVEFQVVNLGLRPIGTVFYRPCGRRPVGPAIETDLDGFTHEIRGSSADPNGALRVGFHLPHPATPIEFPWTVSLRKPLNLFLLVQALDIYCDWTARIAWSSGSSHGVIRVDNHGRRYRIVDGAGSGWKKPTAKGEWSRSLGSAAWIGVKR
ncbi:MAG: hypothetical protein ACTHO8_09410 [Solirubrobacterales bacterium]